MYFEYKGFTWFNKKLRKLKEKVTNIASSLHAREQNKKFGKKLHYNASYTNEDFKAAKKHFKKAVRARKRKGFQDFVCKTDDNNKMVKLGKSLNKAHRIEVGLQADEHGNLLNPQQSLTKLREKLKTDKIGEAKEKFHQKIKNISKKTENFSLSTRRKTFKELTQIGQKRMLKRLPSRTEKIKLWLTYYLNDHFLFSDL